ncbi:MAG: S1 RNA-binding domain-containing protein [Oscillospiraceae bacterium]
MQIEVGAILEGKISGIAAFGAFVELEGGKTGLIHISEIASEYVDDIKKHLTVGQEVKVKVISTENNKISLSVKQNGEIPIVQPERKPVEKRPRRNGAKAPYTSPKRPPADFEFVSKRKPDDMSFDDMLLKFKQDSDEKIQDLKRSNDGKRSGGYKRAY